MTTLVTFSVVMFGISMMSLVLQLITKKKIVEAINKYSPDKKQRTIERHTSVTKIYKALFWMTPLYLLALYLMHKSDDFRTLLIMIIFIYIFTLTDYYYRKSIIKLCDIRE